LAGVPFAVERRPSQQAVLVPRDRGGSFEPQIVKKRQRRLSGVDEMVLSLAESAEALSAAADEFSTAASAHTRDEVATSPQERRPVSSQ
jgi:transposase-like protein